MFTSNCINLYNMPWYYSEGDMNIRIIRLSIFFITGVCVGCPALLWAIGVLCSHHKSGGRISTIGIFLLLSDLLELVLNPIFVFNRFSTPFMLEMLIGARLCGHQLHQLVALESILSLKYPSLTHVFSPHCSIPLCVVVWLVGMGFQFFPNPIICLMNVFLMVLPVIVCAVTCLVTCKASPDTSQVTGRKPGVLVLSVSVSTLFILYVPFFVTIFARLPFMLDALASMRLMSEPLLCVLICRENRMVVETAHIQTDDTQ